MGERREDLVAAADARPLEFVEDQPRSPSSRQKQCKERNSTALLPCNLIVLKVMES